MGYNCLDVIVNYSLLTFRIIVMVNLIGVGYYLITLNRLFYMLLHVFFNVIEWSFNFVRLIIKVFVENCLVVTDFECCFVITINQKYLSK